VKKVSAPFDRQTGQFITLMSFQGEFFDNKRREKREQRNMESGKKKAGIR